MSTDDVQLLRAHAPVLCAVRADTEAQDLSLQFFMQGGVLVVR